MIKPTIYHTLKISSGSIGATPYRLSPKGYLDDIFYEINLSEKMMDGDAIISVGSAVNDPALNVTLITINEDKQSFYFNLGQGTVNTIPCVLFSIKTNLGEVWAINVFVPIISPSFNCSQQKTPLTLVAGFSAYQIAVANGFLGSESDWLESLALGSEDLILGNVTCETLKGSLTECSYTLMSSPRLLDDKVKDFVSVLDYGADNTGNSDSTIAFSYAAHNSDLIFINTGTYALSGNVTGNDTVTWIIKGDLGEYDKSNLPGNYIDLNGGKVAISSPNVSLLGVVDYKGEEPSITPGSKQVYAQNGVLMISS